MNTTIFIISSTSLAAFIAFMFYRDRKRIYFGIKHNKKGILYFDLHERIQKKMKSKETINTYAEINDFIKNYDVSDKSRNKKGMIFLEEVFEKKSDVFIEYLKKEKISYNDINDFKKIIYPKPTDRKETIKQELIQEAKIWYDKNINKQQIVRLAYYYFTFLDIIPEVEGAPRTRIWEELIGVKVGSLNYAHFAKYAFQSNPNSNPSPSAVRKANIELAHYFLGIGFKEGYDHVKLKYPDMDESIN